MKYKFDTDGNAIDLTSGKIEFFEGRYIWYGLAFSCGKVFCGVVSYESLDLQVRLNIPYTSYLTYLLPPFSIVPF